MDILNEEDKGLIVTRTPFYSSKDEIINEHIDIIYNYYLSDYRNRKEMYEKMLSDMEILRERLNAAQKLLQ